MRVAIPIWIDQVCNVLDFAQQMLLVELEDGHEVGRREVALSDDPTALVQGQQLLRLRAQVLICGAVSRPLALFLTRSGVELIPFVRGPVHEVLAAYLSGELNEPRFRLPNCEGYRGMGRGLRARYRKGGTCHGPRKRSV